MNRFFCFGKRAFCDIAKGERGECDDCEFMDGEGGAHEHEIDMIMRRMYGDEYGIERVQQLVEEDRKRAESGEMFSDDPIAQAIYRTSAGDDDQNRYKEACP